MNKHQSFISHEFYPMFDTEITLCVTEERNVYYLFWIHMSVF
jgi:hypothetical protein